MKHVLYISDLWEDQPLFHSQVLPHVNELKKYFLVTLVVMRRGDNITGETSAHINYRSARGDYFYPVSLYNFRRQQKYLRDKLGNRDFDLIYSRGARGGLVGSFIKRYLFNGQAILLNDVRGYSLDGMKVNMLNRFIVNQANRTIIRNSNSLFLVSSYLRSKICSKYGFDQDKAFVFPTFVLDKKFDFNEDNRNAIRQQVGYTNEDIVILYSGSLASYQNIDTILGAFKLSSNDKVKLLILTCEKRIYELLNQYNLNGRVKVVSVRYDEIEKYYHAADYGILIRDNDDTNKSASPTKFAEYINSGLRVIINSIEAEYVRLFEQKRLNGILLNSKEELPACFNSIDQVRIERNEQKINVLSEVVKMQKDILNQITEHRNAV